MKIEIQEGDAVLARFANGLGALGEFRARQVMARGLNRAGMPTLTKVRREIARRTSAPMAIVRKQVVPGRAWAGLAGGSGRLEFSIRASGQALPLAVFKPRELKVGVRAKVWGRFQRFEGAFMRGGQWPNRVQLSMGGQVFVRTSAKRLPIERMYGPALPKELVEEQVVQVFHGAAARLGDDIAHELDRELSRFG